MSHCPTRLVVIVCLAVFTAGCGSGRPAPPTSPTTAIAPPVGNTPNSYTVSGVVTENGRPIAGVNVNAFVQSQNFGYSYMWGHGAVLTDANGGFQMPGLAAGATVWMQTYKGGYVQQCAASPMTVHADATVNLQLVSRANLSADPAQATARIVSGVVVKMTGTGKQPVAGVGVDFEPIVDFPAAITFTDAAGRFALCGLPQDQAVSLGAGAAYLTVPAGQTTVEITLP
jgi:hypothetical protein